MPKTIKRTHIHRGVVAKVFYLIHYSIIHTTPWYSPLNVHTETVDYLFLISKFRLHTVATANVKRSHINSWPISNVVSEHYFYIISVLIFEIWITEAQCSISRYDYTNNIWYSINVLITQLHSWQPTPCWFGSLVQCVSSTVNTYLSLYMFCYRMCLRLLPGIPV